MGTNVYCSICSTVILKNIELTKNLEIIHPIQICKAVSRVTSASNLEGVQGINNLWLIFFKSKPTRLEVYNKGDILILGNHYTFYWAIRIQIIYKTSYSNS